MSKPIPYDYHWARKSASHWEKFNKSLPTVYLQSALKKAIAERNALPDGEQRFINSTIKGLEERLQMNLAGGYDGYPPLGLPNPFSPTFLADLAHIRG